MTTTEKQGLRPKEAAVYLGIGLSTFWLYVKQGKLKATRISDRITLIDKPQMDSFLRGEINDTART
jgi:excisionase family DNA binding protein